MTFFQFADKRGFEHVKDRLAGENLDPTVSIEKMVIFENGK